MQTEPFFANSFEDDLSKEWQRCLQLNENETHNFSRTAISADNNPVEFNFHVVGINLHSPAHKKLLLFIIRRALLLKTSQDYGKDYAEFIDLAAHDLDAPLRKISLLIERLAYKSKFEPVRDIDDYIGRIQANIADMRLLVDSLTNLARINAAVPEKVFCNTGDIISEISNRWEERLRNKNLKLSVSPLPALYGDFGQLKQLFSNLLDNSIKFSKETGGKYIG
jgi:signal transduction histidine kinase